jgi:predicted nucleic acid-binding protein
VTGAHARALYLDASCLLKLFIREPESRRVIELLGMESQVVVSELARLEAETQLRARLRGGLLSKARHDKLARELDATLALDPFSVAPFPPETFERARTLGSRTKVHCRTLDLLHLAAMDCDGLSRLLTNDSAQAIVARSLGIAVELPR